jgi:hypothetical protein
MISSLMASPSGSMQSFLPRSAGVGTAGQSVGMPTAPAPPSLSPSERRTLQLIAEGDLQGALDWVAVQRLKATALVEEQPKGLALTAEGRRALSRVLSRP